MKHLIIVFAALLAVGLTACAQDKNQQTSKEETNMEKKTLVAYFSATGTTKAVADLIAQAKGADIYEIMPEQPYTDADLDWHNGNSRSSVEMKDLKSRPAIKGIVENIAQYDTIFLGYPVWWYQHPTIINTFIEKNNLKGKTVKPFATSGGSNTRKSDQLLKKDYPDINWLPGVLLNNPTPAQIADFIK